MPPALSIAVAGVSVTLAGKPALCGVSWAFPASRDGSAEHWAVLGENGAGKSTFLRLLRGDIRPDQNRDGSACGSILWGVNGEEDTSPLVIKPLSRMVSAELHRLYVRKGWHISGLGLILSGFADSLLPSPASREETETARTIAEHIGAAHLLDKEISTMSQGQLRLVLLARALAGKPKLLLLDEPFDGLDRTARQTLHEAVNVASHDATIICTAHRASDLPACMTHALTLARGKAVSCGPLERHPFTETAVPAAPPMSPTPACPVQAGASSGGSVPYALELDHVNVYVDREHVLRDITWNVAVGVNWRIAGANGSGKSTLLRLVAGLEHAALGGTFRWYGEEHPLLEQRQRETGYLSDLLHAAYRYDLTALELAASGFDGSVGLWRELSRAERREAASWLDALGLGGVAKTPVSRLSSGTARRVFLARALVGKPKMLLLDEPCSGLDTASRGAFMQSLEAALATGVQCLYVTHHDEDVPPGVTRTLFLEQGRVAAIS